MVILGLAVIVLLAKRRMVVQEAQAVPAPISAIKVRKDEAMARALSGGGGVELAVVYWEGDEAV